MVGVTTDNKRVIGGFFPMVNSEGVSLEIIVMMFDQNGDVPDWRGFWKDAMSHGWNPRSTRTKILSCIGEQFGPKVKEHHRVTLNFLHDFEIAHRNDDKPEMQRLLRERKQVDLETQRKRLIKTIKQHTRA